MLCLSQAKKFVRTFLPFLFLISCYLTTSAQHPVYKIDLNQTGRTDAEVNEIGYTSWTLASNVVDTATFSLSGGVRVKLIRKGPYGDKLSSNWYKAGIQT